MKFMNILVPVIGLVVLVIAWQSYGWPGVAMVGGAIVMWALLHITRMMQVMKRAAERPIGHVASAVMLNAKLKPGMSLLHVVAMTRALGALQSPKDTQPEVFRWSDTGGSYVTCVFQGGKVQSWEMVRPAPTEEAPPAPVGPPTAP